MHGSPQRPRTHARGLPKYPSRSVTTIITIIIMGSGSEWVITTITTLATITITTIGTELSEQEASLGRWMRKRSDTSTRKSQLISGHAPRPQHLFETQGTELSKARGARAVHAHPSDERHPSRRRTPILKFEPILFYVI